jgi:hypothetical protein
MIGADLEGADLEGRMVSWAASAISDDVPAARAVIEAHSGRRAAADVAGVASRCRSSQEGAAPASGGPGTRIPATACGRRARRGSGYADIYLPVQGPCR